ncbi:unnamed protein product [Urochloa humidicola]
MADGRRTSDGTSASRTSQPQIEDRLSSGRSRSTDPLSLTARAEPSGGARAGGSDHTPPAGRRAITDADAAPPRQRPNALYELAPTSPSCSPTQPNPTRSYISRLATARRELADVPAPGSSAATPAPLPFPPPASCSRGSQAKLTLVGGARLRGQIPPPRAPGAGRWIG